MCFVFDVLGRGTLLFEYENSMMLIFLTFGEANLVGARGSEHKLKVSNLIQTIFRIFIYTKVNFG